MSLIEVADLQVDLLRDRSMRRVTDGVSFSIGVGESVGLIGESGSGKSITARALARLLPDRAQVAGSFSFDGEDVFAFSKQRLAQHRANEIGFIFQDPAAHINPVRKIGDFMTESRVFHHKEARSEALERAAAALDEVRISQPRRILDQYPHQLSGGMLQRVMIATVMMSRPRFIIADEPTTALDLLSQAAVVRLLRNLQDKHGTSLLFISHDLDLAGDVCDRILVMYAGQIVEQQASDALEAAPLHPYTDGLLGARPSLGPERELLRVIPGHGTSAFEAPAGCVFSERCVHVVDKCRAQRPPLRPLGGGSVACCRAEELAAVRSSAART